MSDAADFFALGEAIRHSGLSSLLALYGFGRRRLEALRFDLELGLLPAPFVGALRLLVFGEAVRSDELSWMPPRALAALVDAGVAMREGPSVRLNGFRLVAHYGVLLFAHQPLRSAMFYHGDDSFGLGAAVAGQRGRVLDLCAGVGAQGLLAAATATEVVAVEIEPAAEPVFWLNHAMNYRDRNAVEFHCGDFIESVQGRRFDVIVCNPPLLPCPPELALPKLADGGADGLAFVRRLVTALPGVLDTGGFATCIGTILGDESGPDVAALQSLAADSGVSLTLLVPARCPMTDGEEFFESYVRTLESKDGSPEAVVRSICGRHFRQTDHLYSFLMHATLGDDPPRFELSRHYVRGVGLWGV